MKMKNWALDRTDKQYIFIYLGLTSYIQYVYGYIYIYHMSYVYIYINIYMIIYIYVYIPWCCKQFVIPTSPSTFWDPIIWSWNSESRHIRTMVFGALGYALYSIIHSNIRISKYTNWYFRLPPGRFSWPARPFQHTESNLFTHTFEYTDRTGVSYYLRGVAVSPALHIIAVTVTISNHI